MKIKLFKKIKAWLNRNSHEKDIKNVIKFLNSLKSWSNSEIVQISVNLTKNDIDNYLLDRLKDTVLELQNGVIILKNTRNELKFDVNKRFLLILSTRMVFNILFLKGVYKNENELIIEVQKVYNKFFK